MQLWHLHCDLAYGTKEDANSLPGTDPLVGHFNFCRFSLAGCLQYSHSWRSLKEEGPHFMEWVNEALGTESFLQGGPGSSGWSLVSTSLLLPAQEYFFILIFIRSLSFVVLYKTLLGLLGPGLV